MSREGQHTWGHKERPNSHTVIQTCIVCGCIRKTVQKGFKFRPLFLTCYIIGDEKYINSPICLVKSASLIIQP